MKDASSKLLDRLGLQHVDSLVLTLRRGEKPRVLIDRPAKPGETEAIIDAAEEETKLNIEETETR